MELATFGAGCFWGVEAAFRKLKGVTSTSVGYMGGHFPNPSYLDVLSRITGHAEVAQVEYDPSKVSYEELLDVFWNIHDPHHSASRSDREKQYRCVIRFATIPYRRGAKRRRKRSNLLADIRYYDSVESVARSETFRHQLKYLPQNQCS
jgi:peptide-methionine (S)-S-oxide reductase